MIFLMDNIINICAVFRRFKRQIFNLAFFLQFCFRRFQCLQINHAKLVVTFFYGSIFFVIFYALLTKRGVKYGVNSRRWLLLSYSWLPGIFNFFLAKARA